MLWEKWIVLEISLFSFVFFSFLVCFVIDVLIQLVDVHLPALRGQFNPIKCWVALSPFPVILRSLLIKNNLIVSKHGSFMISNESALIRQQKIMSSALPGLFDQSCQLIARTLLPPRGMAFRSCLLPLSHTEPWEWCSIQVRLTPHLKGDSSIYSFLGFPLILTLLLFDLTDNEWQNIYSTETGSVSFPHPTMVVKSPSTIFLRLPGTMIMCLHKSCVKTCALCMAEIIMTMCRNMWPCV
jgi:hypothetical protein